MRSMFFYLFTIVTMYSCNSKSTGEVDDLLELDSIVRKCHSLNQFTSFCVPRKSINGIAVCDSVGSKCRHGEEHYTGVLDSIGISVDLFDLMTDKLCKIGFKTYYRQGDYSVWVENGAFGDIYGYLINHNSEVSEVKLFELGKRYRVGIGKEVRKNVYYFSSNL